MKKFLIFVILAAPAWAQPFRTVVRQFDNEVVRSLERPFGTQADEMPIDPSLKPFYHGVASGDPTETAVIIWTRVTPEAGQSGPIEVKWYMATDVDTAYGVLRNIIQQGTVTTDEERDYTVKIDVQGLAPGKTYYYGFQSGNAYSLIGRTRTVSVGEVTHLRFAVVSCSNYEAGYFNAYMGIGQRNDLDAVIHLGDYIYEYGRGTYGNNLPNRKNFPDKEILTLADYRTRYSLYRLDPGLRRAHQQHAFITVWDDHESSNDAYKDGAQNHQENEGSWEVRKAISKRVYAEWMPIRGDAQSIYRSIRYGNLAELIMLDTRLEGREKQINDVTNPALYSPTRTLLGSAQKAWFLDKLKTSTARWKVIGNQVIFSEFNVGWAASALPGGQTPAQLESQFLDIWDGYPVERDQILDTIQKYKINNIVLITGDFHTTFAFDVAKRPSVFGWDRALPTYNPTTGAGSLAVEFAVPSISSANFDENLRIFTGGDSARAVQLALAFQAQINAPLPLPAPNNVNPNPHMKYTDLIRHGYLLLNLTNGAAQGDYVFVHTLYKPDMRESNGQSWFTFDGQNRLSRANAPANGKAIQDKPTPARKLLTTSLDEEVATLISAYPNPTSGICLINFATQKTQNLQIAIYDHTGKQVRVVDSGSFAPGNYTLTCDLSGLSAGLYLIKIASDGQSLTYKIVLK